MTEETSQIPACQRCRLRKIRCDHAAPKCAGCTKASVACIIVDPFTQKQYTREYIHELEQKEKRLSRDDRYANSAVGLGPESQQNEPQQNISPRDAPSAGSGTTFGGFVGESSGLKWETLSINGVRSSSDFRAVYCSLSSPAPTFELEEASATLDLVLQHQSLPSQPLSFHHRRKQWHWSTTSE